MYKNCIGNNASKTVKRSADIESVCFNSIRKVLSNALIEKTADEAGYNFRKRLITPIVTVLHMVLAAIWPEESFVASWQVLWAGVVANFPGVAGYCPSRGSVAKARNRLPLKFWQILFDKTSLLAQQFSRNYDTWKNHRVVLLDGTCLSMPDEPLLRNEFGTNKGLHGDGKYPLLRMVALSLCDTMTMLDYNLGRYDQSEISLSLPLLKKLQEGDILLADRHFSAAHYYAKYLGIGIEFVTRLHQSRKISKIKRLYEYGQNDFIGTMIINPVYRRKDDSLPARLTLRFTMIEMRIRGKHKSVWLVSSLLNNKLYTGHEIAELYSKRWQIESLFKELKVNFSAKVLRSHSVDGIRKEIASRVIAVNVLRIIMLESAKVNGVDPMRISFVGAVRVVLSISPAMAWCPAWRLPAIYDAMLKQIACQLVPKRPGRNEPRAVRREVKHYPSLKVTRKQWRTDHAA